MEKFRKLGLSEPLLKLLEKANITLPSEIQDKAIPLILQGRDIIGGSATGSGKTLAFGAGIIDKTEAEAGAQVLILTPTRELADQVGHVFARYSSYKDLNVAIIYGGVGMNDQVRALRNAEIIVGTPGRILDHLERGTINFSDIKVLVLDEADRMLDMGFIHDVEKIIRNCPKKRQTLLFSATISSEIDHLAKKYMNNPETIAVEPTVSPELLKQIYYDVPNELKFSLLVHLLKRETHGLVMVFSNTRHNADFVGNNLKNLGVDVMVIHGGLTQQKRNKIMEKFSGKAVHVLVCTDIAARGLDIKGISHVYNYDIPKVAQDYIHRIGRTARAGKEGIAINILSDRDYENFDKILRYTELNIERVDTPEVERVRIMLKPDFHRRDDRWDSRDWRARQQKRASHDRRWGSEEEQGDGRASSRGSGSGGRSYGGRSAGSRGGYGGGQRRSSSGGSRGRSYGGGSGGRRFSSGGSRGGNSRGHSNPRRGGPRHSFGNGRR